MINGSTRPRRASRFPTATSAATSPAARSRSGGASTAPAVPLVLLPEHRLNSANRNRRTLKPTEIPQKYLLAAIGLLLLLAHPALARPHISIDSPRWRLESRYDGISLYSSRVEGTGIVPLKAVMTIPASIAAISAVLEDASRRREWVARFGGSVLLEKKTDYEQIEWVRMLMPWPLSDRTARVRLLVSSSDDGKTVTVAGSSVRCCPRSDLPEFVRAEIYESTFQMVRRGSQTEVTALAFVDPRGNVPQWVVNLFTGREARRTLEGLRRQVAKELYPPATLEAVRMRIRNYPGRETVLR